MARGRMLATTIATDKALNSLSIEAELLYLKAVPHLDRDGLIVGDCDLLFAKIAPRRPALIDTIESSIREWITVGLVTRYEWKDGQVLHFHGFRKNNTIKYDREAPSIFPPPPGHFRTDNGLIPEYSASESLPSQDEVPTNSGPAQDKIPLKLKESKIKGEEMEGEVRTSSPAWLAFTKARGVNLSRMDSEQVQELEDLYGSDAVAQAVSYCNAHKKGNFLNLSYMIATLRGWQGDGTLGMHNPDDPSGNGSKPKQVRQRVYDASGNMVWQEVEP